ncbi:hypothetical protein OZX56_05990 [Lactobacillus sp. ESL0684]|nr:MULTISPECIES: hypothetical protein [unclassified Lactobacillus]WEV40453.1 hypothetical protein OZX59_00630 [Lactobacillus sp. ESL0681]WEV43097.1 hypothetical protein OZX56_05990 [Lactobacillus sp. ESL0684]
MDNLKSITTINETMYLENTGVLKTVRRRQNDNTGFTNVDDINWDSL